MAEAIRILADLARFVGEKDATLAERLLPLVMEWAVKRGMSLSELAKALREPAP